MSKRWDAAIITLALLQSGVAMEVTGRCAEAFRLRSDGHCMTCPIIRDGVDF